MNPEVYADFLARLVSSLFPYSSFEKTRKHTFGDTRFKPFTEVCEDCHDEKKPLGHSHRVGSVRPPFLGYFMCGQPREWAA